MAKQVSEILIKLGLQGVEGLDKLKGAFRELEKSIGPNNAAIERARQSIIAYGRDSRNTEQVIKGQIDALRGLQSQVERGSSTWAQLATDIEQFRQASRRTDGEIETLRQSILNSAATHNQSRDSIQSHIRSLQALSQQASLTGATLGNLRRDIANLEQQIEVAEQGSRRFRSALGQALAVNPQSVLNQWRAYRQVLQDASSSAEELALAEQRLRSLSGAPRIEQRRAVSAQAEIVGSAEYQRRFGVGGTALVEQLPDVSAALSQQLRELGEDLQYTARSTETYLQVAMRMATLQRELTATTQGLGAALTAQLRSGELAPTARNLQEAASQLRREMAELDTTTTAGAQAYANNANAVRNLEQQLNDLAQSYRHVGDAARSASTETGGINPILPSGARNPAYRAPLSPAQETAYTQPIGPQAFPEAGRRAQQSIESALDDVNRIYENAKIQRAEIQTRYDNLYTEKLLQGLDLEGQIRDKAFRDELTAFDRQLEARDRKRRGRLTTGQAVQAAGAAISGGIFGGPEGFLGGVGGAILGSAIPGLGTVGGSFAGAAAGAQVGMIRQQLGQFTEQAAEISKLRLGLAGVSKDLREFETSTQAVEAASQSLLLPLADTYKYYTQLRASTVELNYSADETRKILEGTASAVLKTGGSLSDVDGAMRAVVQILSKGKAAAEEVRGQLGERFPGAVIKFAQANKMSVQELDQAFQAGTVTIEKFITFAKQNYEEGGKYVETLANSTEYAGKRMEKALENLRLAVGRSLKDSGAGFQNFATEAAESLLWLGEQMASFANKAEMFLGGGVKTQGGTAKEIAERIIGGGTSVSEIEQSIQDYENKIKEANDRLASVKTRNVLQTIFDETFGAGTPTQGQTTTATAALEKRIALLREALKLANDFTRKGKPGAFDLPISDDASKKAADKAAKDAQVAADQQQRLNETLMQQRIRMEDAVFKHQVELDKRRHDMQQERLDLEARVRISGLSGVERQMAADYEALRKELQQLENRNREAVTAVRAAQQQLTAAQQMRTVTSTGGGTVGVSTSVGINTDTITRATQAASKFNGIANQCSESVKEFYKSLGITLPGVTAWADTVRNAGTVMRDWSKLQPGDIVATGRPGDTPHVGVYTGGNNVFHQSRSRGLRAGNYPDLDYFRSGYFVRPGQTMGQGRLPGGIATQQRRATADLGDVEVARLGLQAAQTAQRDTQQQTAALRPNLIKLSISESLQPLRDQNEELQKSINLEQQRIRLIAEGFGAKQIDHLMKINEKEAERAELIAATTQVYGADTEEANIRIAETNNLYDTQIQKLERLYEIQQAPGVALQERIGTLKAEIAELADYENVIISMSQTVEQSFATAIGSAVSSLVTGAASIKQVLADMFRSIGEAFIQMAAQIIAKQVVMITLQTILKALGLAGGFSGGGGGGGLGGVSTAGVPSYALPSGPGFASGFAMAKGGVVGANGIQPFANGGIVTKPTFFKYAKGGAMQNGLMGEAGPEAIMPLKRGADGKLGVAAQLSGAMGRYRSGSGSGVGTAASGMEPAKTETAGGTATLDVRYTVERINNVDYVTADQFQAGLRQAASQGAERGQQLALRRLQQSPSTRRRIGL